MNSESNNAEWVLIIKVALDGSMTHRPMYYSKIRDEWFLEHGFPTWQDALHHAILLEKYHKQNGHWKVFTHDIPQLLEGYATIRFGDSHRHRFPCLMNGKGDIIPMELFG